MRTVTPRGHGEHDRGKVEHARDSRRDQLIGGLLGGRGGGGDHTDRHVAGGNDAGQFVDRADLDRVGTLADRDTDLAGVDVDDADHAEAALVEPAIAGKGLAEVAGAHDHDRPVVVEPQFAADLVHEVGHFVADPAHAVAPEVRQVLADLGGVHAGQIGEPLRRDVVDPVVGLLDQDLEVDGQPRHGGFRDAASAGWHRVPA